MSFSELLRMLELSQRDMTDTAKKYNLQPEQMQQAANSIEVLKGLGFDFNDLNTRGKDPGMKTVDKFNIGLNAVQTGLGAYLGLKQLGLANKNYKLQREAFNTNMANQKKSLNRELREQYMRAEFKDRLAPSEEAYMQRWGY